MKLAVGEAISAPSIDEDIADHIIYSADRNVDITLIHLTNESEREVVINLFIEFVEKRVRILPLNKVIDPNGMILFENLKYSLVPDEKLIIKANITGVITYIVNGDHT